MDDGHKITIAAVIGDKILRTQLAEGILRHTQIVLKSCATVAEAVDAARGAAAVVLCDAGAGDAKLLRDHPGILPLLISDGTVREWPDQNIVRLPLRLGDLLDRIVRHGAMRQAHAESFMLGTRLVSPDEGTLTDAKTGAVTKLTEKERDILLKLYESRGRTVDRRALLDGIWGYGEGIETHTLETHIYRLRQKIEDDPAKPDWLLTEESGYRLAL